MSDSMQAIQDYHLIKSEDLFWRPSNLMQIPNASRICGMGRTGSGNKGARLGRTRLGASLVSFLALIGSAWLFLTCPVGQAVTRLDLPSRDGDTVVFLGDSITAARGYTKIVELYTLMRHPELRVRFWNAGKGGDTAAGAVEPAGERCVFARGHGGDGRVWGE